jgi:site-specific DNA-methyltransferase (adenine-specific)
LDQSDTLGGFFVANPVRERDHIAQKPVSIMRELVKIVRPGETILDPFAGAGTTGVASLAEGRRFVGIELAEHYVAVAAERLASAAMRPSDATQADIFDALASQ